MYKRLSVFLSLLLLLAMVGCSAQSKTAESDGNAQISEPFPLAADTEDSGDSEDSGLPSAYIYTTENNIYPMSDAVTVGGIAYQVLHCEKTQQFGNRDLEHLNYFYNDQGIDDQGNLINDNSYIFATIQYTNTTDSPVEIIRGNKGIYSLNEHMIVDYENIDSTYIDTYWNSGTDSQPHHYELAPGETITSESGWVLDYTMLSPDALLYYVPNLKDVLTDFGGSTDPDAVFIKLEF